MPPDMVSYQGYDFSCDLWALNVTIFEICTGDVPFHAQTEEQLEEEILEGIIMRGRKQKTGWNCRFRESVISMVTVTSLYQYMYVDSCGERGLRNLRLTTKNKYSSTDDVL